MADVAAHPDVRRLQPLIAESLIEGASPQLRNMASIGGNLLQRVRCPYFRMLDARLQQARSRARAAPRSTASTPAMRSSARATIASRRILRISRSRWSRSTPRCGCAGPQGERSFPGRGALPAARRHAASRAHAAARRADRRGARARRAHSRRARYLKVRDRASYEFALVSAAAALDIEDGVIRAGAHCRRRRRHAALAHARLRGGAGRQDRRTRRPSRRPPQLAAAGRPAAARTITTRSSCCRGRSSAPSKWRERSHERRTSSDSRCRASTGAPRSRAAPAMRPISTSRASSMR